MSLCDCMCDGCEFHGDHETATAAKAALDLVRQFPKPSAITIGGTEPGGRPYVDVRFPIGTANPALETLLGIVFGANGEP